MSGPSTEERVERVRMALAEAGYPDQCVTWCEDPDFADGQMVNTPVVPNAVWWRALAVADPEGLACWSCWDIGTLEAEKDCTHDPLTSPWPPLTVEREER